MVPSTGSGPRMIQAGAGCAGAFVFVWLLLVTIFGLVGAGMVWSQHRKIATARPAPATIRAARVERRESTDSEGGRSVSHAPVVEFDYQVDGRTYRGRDPFAIRQSRSEAWAERTTALFAPGQQATAYYDPASPGSAFLLRQYSFMPYMFVLLPALMFVFGAGSFGIPVFGLPAARRWRAVLLLAGLWHGVGLIAGGHYFLVAPTPHDTAAYYVLPIYELLGSIPLAIGFRGWRAAATAGTRWADAQPPQP